jgi:hypothetical protein
VGRSIHQAASDQSPRFGQPRKLDAHQRQEAIGRLAKGETARTYGVDLTTLKASNRPEKDLEAGGSTSAHPRRDATDSRQHRQAAGAAKAGLSAPSAATPGPFPCPRLSAFWQPALSKNSVSMATSTLTRGPLCLTMLTCRAQHANSARLFLAVMKPGEFARRARAVKREIASCLN